MSGSAISGFAWPTGALDAPSTGQSVVSLSSSSLLLNATSTMMSIQPSGSSALPVSPPVGVPQANMTSTFGSGMPSSSFVTVYMPTVTSGSSVPAVSNSLALQSIQPIVLDQMSQPGVPVNESSSPRTVRITVTSTVMMPSDTPMPSMAALAKALEQPDTIPTSAKVAAADVTGVKFELYGSPEAVVTKSSKESSNTKAIIYGISGVAAGLMLIALIYIVTR